MGTRINSLLLLCVLFIVKTSANVLVSQKCEYDDDECILAAANEACKNILAGNSDLDAEPLNPITIDKIEGSMYGMDYVFSPANVASPKGCEITQINVSLEKERLHVTYYCPEVIIYGGYKMSGLLLGFLPVYGDGNVTAPAKEYETKVDAPLIFHPGSDGKKYMNIDSENYKLNMNLKGGVEFHLTGLFDDQPELAKAAIDFSNQNWRLLAKEFQVPLFQPFQEKIIDQANKFLDAVPVDDLFLDDDK